MTLGSSCHLNSYVSIASRQATVIRGPSKRSRPQAATKRIETWDNGLKYSHAPYNDVSVNDGPHIRQWSRKIIIPLCYNCLQYSVP